MDYKMATTTTNTGGYGNGSYGYTQPGDAIVDPSGNQLGVTQPSQQTYNRVEPWTSQYVCSIITAICCFSPCSILGVIYIIAARHEYVHGNPMTAQSKKTSGLCWMIFGIVIPIIVLIIFIAIAVSVGLFTRSFREEFQGYANNGY